MSYTLIMTHTMLFFPKGNSSNKMRWKGHLKLIRRCLSYDMYTEIIRMGILYG